MLLWDRVREERRADVAAVVTPSGIVRWQQVDADAEPAFHALLTAFGRETGALPALLNTSLNLPGRPAAVTPRDALEIYATTGLDALFLGPYLVAKS
jgi:carbamoyltransferase